MSSREETYRILFQEECFGDGHKLLPSMYLSREDEEDEASYTLGGVFIRIKKDENRGIEMSHY